MTKRNIFLTTIIVALSALMFSCTDNFEDYNINKIGVTDEDLTLDYNDIGAYFPQIQQMIYVNYNWGDGKDWTYQLTQNLNADIFSGYMMSATDFAGNENNTTYALVDGWNGASWEYTYAHMMPPLFEVEKKVAAEPDYAHFGGVAKILKVFGMSRIANQYGPIIYTKYGQDATGSAYDKPEDTYNQFFKDLEDAASTLKAYVSANPGATPFAKFDMMFGGDYDKWIKLANSLRLRLAIQVSGVKPELAKQQAEAAVQGGVFTNEVATVSGRGYTHPLDALTNSWGDISMGASIESIMQGYEDPRLAKYFVPAADANAAAAGFEFKGIRQGIALSDATTYRSHSKILVESSTPAILLTAAEVYFLRAEGALNGWNMGGTAKDLYESGIAASMDQWGASIGDYLTSDKLPSDYVDLYNPSANNIAAQNTVSPAWDESADREVKQQKISTQKWIAMFPEGIEGWTEVRRTGYPKLFPVVINLSGGKIDTNKGVRRLPLPASERDKEGYSTAVSYLNGPDTGGTNLWWDVK